jgi:hypothetical protein
MVAAACLLAGTFSATAAHASDPWDPYNEGLSNTNADIGYPTFVNSGSAIPDKPVGYSPDSSYLADIFAADLAAGAGTAPGNDFWVDEMLVRRGVQPDEPGGQDFATGSPQNIDYDNNAVLFSRGRALYMEESVVGLGFLGRVAYIENLGNRPAYTLTARVNGSVVTLSEDQSKRHNAPSYWHSEFNGGGLLVTQTKWISHQNVAVEWLQVRTTDGTTKDVVFTVGSGLATQPVDDELQGTVATPHDVTRVNTRLSGDGFDVDGQNLTRTVQVGSGATDVKLQMGFTTPEIPESTTEYESVVDISPAEAFQMQTTTYNQWWVDNIPYIETPSPEIDKVAFYRWWLLRTNHLDANVPGNDFQFPTSIEGVFGAAYNNAIVLTVGMFVDDMKYFRDPSSAYGSWVSAGEVARQSRYIDNPGNPNNWNSSYANYISEAAWNSYAVHGGDPVIAGQLATYADDDIAGQLSAFDSNNNNLVEYANPAMTGNDVDAVSFSWRGPGAWESYPMDRPESAYLYSGALAASEAYRVAGDHVDADRMEAQAEAVKQGVLDVLWEDERTTPDEAGMYGNMIKAAYSNSASGLPAGTKIPWKEVNMYYPYTVGLMPQSGDDDFDPKYLEALRLFVDSEQYSPFPFFTANQSDAKARADRDADTGRHYSNNFSTINSTVMFRLLASTLRDYENPYLTSDYFEKLLYWSAWSVYEKGDVTRHNQNEFWAHGSPDDGGSILYRSWIHQTQLGTSNFALIEDVAGLQPRIDDVIELSPIDIGWDHFTVNNLRYHDKDLTIVWDEPGGDRHYEDVPEGYSILLDGERVLTIDSLAPVTLDTATGNVETEANVLFNAASPMAQANEVRFDADDRVVDIMLKAGLDIDLASSAAPNLAESAPVQASFSASGTTGVGHTFGPEGAVDGSTVNEPFWGTAGSPNASDWITVDLGQTTTINEARLHFYRTSSSSTVQGYTAPVTYAVQYRDGDEWVSVADQSRTPHMPAGNLNVVRFADVVTDQIRLLVTHQGGTRTGVKEIILRNSPTAYEPSENRAPVVNIQQVPLADPTRASFVGSVSDDGLPAGEITQQWTVEETPSESASASFADSGSATTTVAFSEPGDYVLRFAASDGDLGTEVEQQVTVLDAPPLGPNIAGLATPTASYTAPWNRVSAVNNGDIVSSVSADQTRLWGTFTDTNRPATRSLTYTWPSTVRVTAASVYFWRDSEQGTGAGVAIPQGWSLEYLDSGGQWMPVVLREEAEYPTNDLGMSSEVAFEPVNTTALRATFQASPNEEETAHSAVGVSEFEVFSDYPVSYEALAVRTTVDTPITLPNTAWVVFPDHSRGQLPVTWDAIDSSQFDTPGTFDHSGHFTGSDIPISGTISVGDSGDDVHAVEPQSLSTFVGVEPDLPRTAVVLFSGGTGARETRSVTWDVVPHQAYATVSEFTVQGTIAGTEIRATATVQVLEPDSGGEPPPPTIISGSAVPTASYTAPWNDIAALNDGDIVSSVNVDQARLWGTYTDNNRPSTQTVTYTWPASVRAGGASAYFWRDSEQGTGTGVAIPEAWSLEYLDSNDEWQEVTLLQGALYPTNDLGSPSEISFEPVNTTVLRATFQASPNAEGTAHSAVGVSEFEVLSAPVDKSDLETAIEVAEELNEGDYTAESWQALDSALSAAQTVRDDEDASAEQVAAATSNLTDAIDGLVEVSPTIISGSAVPTASYTAPWNDIAALNDGDIVSSVNVDQARLWGTYTDNNRPSTQTVTYTWPASVRAGGASAYFWRDSEQGTGTGVAIPEAWSLEYLDSNDEWQEVTLLQGALYPTNDLGSPSEISFEPVNTTVLRATFQASPNAEGSAHSAVGVSEFEVLSAPDNT